MARSSKRKTRRVVDETSEAEVAQDTNNTGEPKNLPVQPGLCGF